MRAQRPVSTVLVVLGVLAGALLFSSAPALADAPEAPVTISPANAITSTSAVLEGTLNPGVSAKAGWYFAYSTEAACVGAFTTAVEPEVEGKALPEHAEATGLEPDRKYTFCMVATNEAGEATQSSNEVSFETLAVTPTVIAGSESASGVTPFEATLNATINPNNQETTYAFEYSTKATGETLEGAIATVPGAGPLLAEFGERSASIVTGAVLMPATTYYYRVAATNGTGTMKGKVEHFTTLTLEKPIVAGESVSGLTSTDASLEAKVNPNYQETGYHFEYSTEATGETLEGPIMMVEGSPPAPALTAVFEEQFAGPSDIGGTLTPGVIYFYRVVATNGAGTTNGIVQSFQTLAKPAVTTAEAQNLTRTSTTLSGTVNPVGAATTYHFAYVPASEYELGATNPYANGTETLERSAGSDYTTHAVGPLGISELKPGTTYDYAVVATNSVGTTIGPNVEFTTPALTPPVAVTGEALNVTQLSATLNGTVDTKGLPTTLRFEFGTSPGSGSFEAASIIPGSEAGSVLGVSLAFGSSLQPGIVYYYRTVASNADGTSYGEERSFTTGSIPGLPALSPVPTIIFPASPTPTPPKTTTAPAPIKTLTSAQKLAKALRVCKQDKPKSKRAKCEKQARKTYAPATKKRKH